MFEPLIIENNFHIEEIKVVYPVDNCKGAEVGTSKALLVTPELAIIYDNGHATVDYVAPSKFFGGKYYEIADGFRFHIAEFYYKDELEVYDAADIITLGLIEQEEAELLAG